MKKTTIISIEQFNSRSGKNWGNDNVCEFRGIIPGYVCGFNVECEKDGVISACSTCFTNDFEYIMNPQFDANWNDLGISEDFASHNGWKSTGNIVFRGYYYSEYDWEEREEYFTDASKEVEALWDKYVINE